jgi:hypothetical protein
MARQIYSWLFREDTITPGGVIVLPLDPAFTYVVRDCTGIASSAADMSVSLNVNINGTTMMQFGSADLPTTPFSWQGHIVVPGTDSLELACFGTAGFINFALSGYKLFA